MKRRSWKRGTDSVFGLVVLTASGGAVGQPLLVGSVGTALASGEVRPVVPTAPGNPDAGVVALDWTGTLTSGENLAFAVFNGEVRFAAPEPGDVPLSISGALVAGGAEPSFTLGGSFTSPTRSYVFDVFVDGFAGDLTVTPNTIVIAQSEDDLTFDLVINRRTGLGSFSYRETVLAGGVELTRSASGTIGGVTPVPSPATASLLLAGGGLALRRRR